MHIGKSKDVPAEISKAGLSKWYSGLDDRDRIRVGRYVGGSDVSSLVSFCGNVITKANDDHNYAVSVMVADLVLNGKEISALERYDILEALVIAYYGMEDYDNCLRVCDEGLKLFPEVKTAITERNGGLMPETMNCRNYKINVLVGVFFDYDAGDATLDEYCEAGLISKEESEYRKRNNKIFRLQRSFDGIYAIKLKE